MTGIKQILRGISRAAGILLAVLSISFVIAAPGVKLAEERDMVQGIQSMSQTASTALSSVRWDLQRIQAAEAWQITSGNRDIIVAVLDTGIDESNPNLNGTVVKNANFSSSATVKDINGHGTHIAGIIAGKLDSEAKSAGLAYSSRLLNVKVADDNGFTEVESVAAGIIWATDNGANIINISLALRESTPALEKAVSYAWQKGALILAAAGNTYGSAPVYPAASENVIAVSATDNADKLAAWANKGNWVDVVAPGASIYSTGLGDKLTAMSGTSQAAALVSGEAALLYAIATDINGNGQVNDEVAQAIVTGTDSISNATGHSRTRINALKALEVIQSMIK